MFLNIYFGMTALSYISINAWDYYCTRRLKKDGYVFLCNTLGDKVSNQVAYLGLSLMPIVNFLVPVSFIVNNKEKSYQELLDDGLAKGTIKKVEVHEEKDATCEVKETTNRLKIEYIEKIDDIIKDNLRNTVRSAVNKFSNNKVYEKEDYSFDDNIENTSKGKRI